MQNPQYGRRGVRRTPLPRRRGYCTNPAARPPWFTQGNAGTSLRTDFLGTVDNTGLAIRTNNLERLRITNLGRVGIGTIAPGAKLQVSAGGTDMAVFGGGGVIVGSGGWSACTWASTSRWVKPERRLR